MTNERRWNTIERLQTRYERLIAAKLDRRERNFERWLQMIGREMRRQQALAAAAAKEASA